MSPRFAILNPCAKRWSDLSGEGRKCFCDECRTDVHALDQYSVEEFAELKRKSGRVRIRVTDFTGAVIPGAEVTLLTADDKPQRSEPTDDMGEIIWTDLPFGESKITVASRGFETRRLIVTVRNSDEIKVDAKLGVGGVGSAVTVPPPSPKRHWWQIFR